MTEASPSSEVRAPDAESSAVDRRARLVLLAIGAFYLLSLCALVALDQIGVVWKSMVVPSLAIAAIAVGRLKQFVRDWAVFLAAVVLFDAGRGVVYGLVVHFHWPIYMGYAIRAERAIFGEPLLTNRVQSLLTPGGQVGAIDRLLAVVYASHFLWFLVFGLGLWLMREREFGRFKASMLIVMYGGLACYVLVPTVPPWMAAHQYFVIPGVAELGAQLFHGSLPSLSAAFEVNPVAAMPSLHCAFPTLITLIAFRAFGRWGFAMLGYTLIVYLSTVHLGHHYGVDVLGGIALALVAYAAVYASDRIARMLGALRSPSESSAALRLRALIAVLLLALTEGSGPFAALLAADQSNMPTPTEAFIARELAGKSPMVNYYRGRLAQAQGRNREAEALFKRAIAEVPDDLSRQSALGMLALAAYANQDYPTVVSAAGQLPGMPSGLALAVAESLVKTGRAKAGFGLLDSVAADHPDEPEIAQMRARLAAYRVARP